MNSFALLLMLVLGLDHSGTLVSSPKGGDSDLTANDSLSTGTEAPSLKAAIAKYIDGYGRRYYVRGKSDSQHLIEDHGWTAEQIRGLTLDEIQYLHGATHQGRIKPEDFDNVAVSHAAPFSRGESVGPRSPGADNKPAITIAVAPFHCPPCNQLKTFDWSGFDVTWKTGGAVSAFPEISWTDKRGTKRILTGAYTPNRVRWSYNRTME